MSNPVTITHNILVNACKRHGAGAVLTSSFQTQSAPLLHMVSRWCPDMRVWFIDTGFHFAETIEYKKTLKTLLGLRVEVIRAPYDLGPVYQNSVKDCCAWNKTLPLQKAMRTGVTAWLSGIRADQTALRARKPPSEYDGEIERIYPVLHWTAQDVAEYAAKYKLPEHPLTAQGYESIGCAPCTVAGEDRAGRWPGSPKVECELHR